MGSGVESINGKPSPKKQGPTYTIIRRRYTQGRARSCIMHRPSAPYLMGKHIVGDDQRCTVALRHSFEGG
jgi:hypothetical protein